MDTEALVAKVEKIKMPIRLLILIGTVIVFVGLFGYLVYIPKTTAIKATIQETEGLKQQLNRAKVKSKEIKKWQAQKAQVDVEFNEALKILPNTKEIPNLLRKVTELGNESRLDFRVFRPKRESPKEFYIEIPVAIEVWGEYHDVAVFFDKVGHMERIMNIKDVTMKPEKALSTRLITTCDAITYRFKGN